MAVGFGEGCEVEKVRRCGVAELLLAWSLSLEG
jgi:hypothetical protein